MKYKYNVVTLLVVFHISRTILGKLIGHKEGGRLVYPPGRSSLWRYNYTNVPVNENDYKINCGGFKTRWLINNGKCGVCGDPWTGSRDHEYGGKYFSGYISKSYIQNTVINVSVEILENLNGWFEFKLCPYKNLSDFITQTCLDKNTLEIGDTGRTKYRVKQRGIHVLPLKLPNGIMCKRCLLQWRYHTGTRWGCDSAKKCCKGCGPKQEEFYSCADVSIKVGRIIPAKDIATENLKQNTGDTKCEQFSVYQRWWCRTQCVDEECYSGYCACLHQLQMRTKRHALSCKSISIWTSVGMTIWCNNNCNNAFPYCPIDVCECEDPSLATSTTTATTTTVSMTTTTKSTIGTTSTTSVTVPTTTSTTTTTQKPTTTSTTTTTQKPTTAPYPADAPGIVKVLATAGCEYCRDKNNITCTNLYCPGYGVTTTGISGSNLYEKVDKLSEHFCEVCDLNDSICERLFCTTGSGDPIMRNLGIGIKCRMCSEFGDQTCLRDPACSGNVNGNTESTTQSTTSTTPSTTTIVSPIFIDCVPKKEYEDINGIKEWCDQAYPDYGSIAVCDCLGPMALGEVSYEDGYVCQGAGAYVADANMAVWCLSNCANNYCPSSHCFCYPPTTTESTSTTATTKTSTTDTTQASTSTDTSRASISTELTGPSISTTTSYTSTLNILLTDYRALNTLNGMICKMSQSDEVKYSATILRYCPVYDIGLKDISENLDRTIRFTTEIFHEFSVMNRQDLTSFTSGRLDSRLASYIRFAFCGGCQGFGGQNCTNYCNG